MRRMVIFAAEDIGVADPRALQVAMAATDAVRFIGLPEGTLPMSEAAIYLSLAPKSNSAIATYQAAKRAVEQHGALPVPLHLRNAPTKMMRDYLPDRLRDVTLYQPSSSGYERTLGERLRYLRGQPSEEAGADDKKTSAAPQIPASMRGHVDGKQ